MSNRYFLALCVVTLLGAETWAAEHSKFASQPVSGAIVIDGRHDDWSGAVEPFGTEPVSIQVANDGTFLYLRMVTSDPSARNQITRHGFIVWFDEDGKTKKRFGLKYPVVESSGEPQEAVITAGTTAVAAGLTANGRARRATSRPTASTFLARTKTTSGA